MNSLAIFGAKYLIFVAVALAGLYFLRLPWHKKKEVVIFGIIILPLIYIATKIAAMLYYDPRPFVVNHFTPLIPHEPDNGFPSDHVLLITAVASIVFLFNKKIAVIVLIIAVLVGISRVFTGIHHPIDILGSVIISVGVSSLVYILRGNFIHPKND